MLGEHVVTADGAQACRQMPTRRESGDHDRLRVDMPFVGMLSNQPHRLGRLKQRDGVAVTAPPNSAG